MDSKSPIEDLLLKDLSEKDQANIKNKISEMVTLFKGNKEESPYLLGTKMVRISSEFAETFVAASGPMKLEIATYVVNSVLSELKIDHPAPEFLQTVIELVVSAAKGKFAINQKQVGSCLACFSCLASMCKKS